MSEKWIEVSLYCKREALEPVYGMLFSLGYEGAQIIDDDYMREFLQENIKYFGYVDETLMSGEKQEPHINVYVPDDIQSGEKIAEIQSALSSLCSTGAIDGKTEIKLGKTEKSQWYEKWKQYFKQLEIGKNILICPEWVEPKNAEGKLLVKIDPGMLFGTGTHNTTRLCCEILEQRITKGCNVLDIGSGSGILSIVALLLGASSACAVDIEQDAQKIAHQNASLNGIDLDLYDVQSGNILDDATLKNKYKSIKFDVITANIIADVIIPLSSFVGDYMKEGAVFICSGIIDSRYQDTKNALSSHFTITSEKKDGEWWAFVCER